MSVRSLCPALGQAGLLALALPILLGSSLIGAILSGADPLAVGLTSAVAHASTGDDGVFTVRTLSQARTAAGQERLVLVFLTQSGNDDCDFMEAQAWSHPDVQAWVGEHAVAAKVDTESFHGASLMGRYGVDSVPALLAFRGDTLARRHEGPLDGDKLLAWLEIVRVGDVEAADLLMATDSPAPTSDEVDVDSVLIEAMNAPNPMAATATLLGAWRQTVGTPQQDPRRQQLLEALEPYLINQESRELVQRERDAAWSRHRRHKLLPDLVDWVTLNHLLEEDSVTLEWVHEARDDKKGRAQVQSVVYHPQDPLLAVLAKRGEWKTLGQVVGDPIDLVDGRMRVHKATRITITGAESQADRALLRNQLAAIVAGLLAEGRDREAKATAEHILDQDNDAGPTVVQVCMGAGQPRRWMRGLLNPHKAEQVQLAMELTQALQMR